MLVLFLEVFMTVYLSTCFSSQLEKARLILESKGMRAIFQKKWPKKDKILENFGKNVQNLKIF